MKTRVWTLALLVAASPLWAAGKKVFDGPLADDGRITLAFGATVADGAVSETATADDEWHEYLVTVPEKVALKGGGVYRVTYDYLVTKDLAGNEPYFYHLLRAGDAGDNDRGWETFTAKTGEKGTRRFVATLAKMDGYRLIIGVHFAGGVKISNLIIEDLSPAAGMVFVPYFVDADERVQLDNGATIAADAVTVDTSGDDDEWHEYLHTVPASVPLKSEGRYKISYDYQVTKALGGGDASFYHLVRCPDGNDKDVGMEMWTAPMGDKGHKEFTAELQKAEGYYLILGIRFKGGIKISNLQIEDLAAKK
jgi:hypothetical protein